MFHFDRRGYIVGKSLSKTIIPFLDHVKPGARRRGVGFVFNEGGVLRGLKNRPPDPQIADLGGSPRYHCPRGNPADINLTSAENHSPQK
jgi:hypothetical protein